MNSADPVDLSLCFALAVLKARPQKVCLFDALYSSVTGDSALGISPIPCRQLESPHISILCMPRLHLWQEVSEIFSEGLDLRACLMAFLRGSCEGGWRSWKLFRGRPGSSQEAVSSFTSFTRMIYKGNFTSRLREGIPVLLHTATESIFLSSALHRGPL